MEGFVGALPAVAAHTAQTNNVDAAGHEFKNPASADAGDHYAGPGKGKTKIEPNIPHSVGSDTEYAKSDKPSVGMPAWHRSSDHHVSRRGG